MVLIVTKVKRNEVARTYTIPCKNEIECQAIIDKEKQDDFDDFFFSIYKDTKIKKQRK